MRKMLCFTFPKSLLGCSNYENYTKFMHCTEGLKMKFPECLQGVNMKIKVVDKNIWPTSRSSLTQKEKV